MANPVSMEEYKTFASITGVKQDSRVETLLEYSKTLVENYLGIQFAGTSNVITIYTDPGRSVYFVNVVGGRVLRIVHTPRNTKEPVELDPDDYIVEGSRIEFIGLDITNRDKMDISVSASSLEESAEDATPTDVKLAIMLLTQYYYKEEYNKTAATNGGQQIDYAESNSLPNRVRAILDFHRVL